MFASSFYAFAVAKALVLFGFVIPSLAAGSALWSRSDSSNSSTFFYQRDNANLTLTLAAAADTGDIAFRLSAPAQYDWISIGIGAQMKGALMFIAYPTKNGTAVTFSPRLSTGHTEPAYAKQINAGLVSDPHAPNSPNAQNEGQMIFSAICRNCTRWTNPPLDLTSTKAPFMFAVGPISITGARWSDSPAAPLRSHSLFGKFTMNMRQATIPSGTNLQVPALGSTTNGASPNADVTKVSHDYLSTWHTITMCLAFAFFLPLDAIFRKCFHRIGFHLGMQGVIAALFIAGLATGFILSEQFVRSKTYSSPHQVIGFIILLFYLAQFPLGYLHHRNQKNQKVVKNIGLAHYGIGFLIFLLAIVDAGLGFNFALASNYNKLWAPLSIAIVIIYSIVMGAKYFWDKTKKDAKDEEEDAAVLKEIRAEQAKYYDRSQQIVPGDQPPQYPGYGAPNSYGAPGPYAPPPQPMPNAGFSQPGEVGYQNVSVPRY